MTLIILLAITLAAVTASLAIYWVNRRHDTPPELRQDWWTQFERDFRAYAAEQRASHRRIDD